MFLLMHVTTQSTCNVCACVDIVNQPLQLYLILASLKKKLICQEVLKSCVFVFLCFYTWKISAYFSSTQWLGF